MQQFPHESKNMADFCGGLFPILGGVLLDQTLYSGNKKLIPMDTFFILM
jgi:hypothetical protein